MILEIQQRYRYSYTQPVTDVRQRLMMVPPDAHGDQQLVSFELLVHGDGPPSSPLVWETDDFGNRVCRVIVPRVERNVEFEARYRVRRYARTRRAPTFDPEPYVGPTYLTAPDDRLQAVATSIRDRVDSARRRAEGAFTWAATAIEFRVGVTGVHTPASLALKLGGGVCQDFTHLLLSLLRLLGIPARYVSGHLMGDGVAHAWVEALVDGEVIAYDPTHRRRTHLEYVTVAVGRDFADISPTSGVFRGAAVGHLTASKRARALGIDGARAVRPEAVA